MNREQHTIELPAEQLAYMERVASLLSESYVVPPKACVTTYGCQQNVSDSERIQGMLVKMGYVLTDNMDEADFILYNTCAVRGHAEDRVWGNIGTIKNKKQKRPGLIAAVCGCMAQQESVAERIRRSYPYIDLVFGTHVLWRLPEFLYRRLSGGGRIFELSMEENRIVESLPVHRDGTLKGWLPIMYGCNNFCTYCIVPYVRGRERSREPDRILAEAEEMIAAGIKEITLLGQNVNSYGLDASFDLNFAGLLRRLNAFPGDFRIRFMTSHPKDCTLELLDAMRDCDKVCKHLHLPVQSGSDRILKLMNRRYTREDYLALVAAARERMPEITLTSDIIVGFPGETYEDFLQTLDLIREVEYSSLFTFIYSPREGTPAARMSDPISRAEKGRWFQQLLKAQEEISERLNQAMIGHTYQVLCDDTGRAPGYVAGHTSGNIVLEFPGVPQDIGSYFNVTVQELTNALYGAVIK